MADIMNPVLAGYLRTFGAPALRDPDLETADLFERLTAFCIIGSQDPDYQPSEDVIVSGGNDTGIDAIGLVVNGHLITRLDQLDDLARRDYQIDASFSFIQAKSSTRVGANDVGVFLDGVRDFFAPQPVKPANGDITHFRELKDLLYQHSIKFAKNPVCSMYFATAGVIDNEDANIRALEQRVVEDLNSLHIFSHVDFYLHDAIQLQQQYQRISHRNIREIEFPQHTLLPAINGIHQAFIGVIPVSPIPAPHHRRRRPV